MATTKTAPKRTSRLGKALSRPARRTRKAVQPPVRHSDEAGSLPFSIDRSQFPRGPIVPNTARFHLCSAQAEVAQAALSSGFDVVFDCPIEAVATAIVSLQHSLSLPLCADYNADDELLVLWTQPRDFGEDTEARTPATCSRCGCYGCGFEATSD